MKLIKNPPKFTCSAEKDWVEVIGSTANITDEARALHGEIRCSFTGKNFMSCPCKRMQLLCFILLFKPN